MWMLTALIPNAMAAGPITLPTAKTCPPSNHPCLGVLDMDMEIFPPDLMLAIEREIAPQPLDWMEVTLTTYAGSVDLTIDGTWLDPRNALVGLRGELSWVVPVRDPARTTVEIRNRSSRTVAEYAIDGEVLVKAE